MRGQLLQIKQRRHWQAWALAFGCRLTNAVRASAANLVRVSDDGRSSWSAAWGVFALVFIGAAAIAWSAVLAHAATLDLALAGLFSFLTTASLYMCFAYLCRWWPTGRMLIGESSHIHLAQPAPYIAITPRVFISCAPGRLREYRTAASEVCRRLGMTPVYASSDARSITVRRKHREDVRSADVFLLLVAHRYGTRLPWQRLSNIELEYQWAMNQPETKVLVFLANENTSWPLVDIDRGRNAEALISFVAKLKKLHQIHSMSDLTDFRAVLIRTLASVHLPHLHDEDSESGILSWGGQDWIPTPPALHAVPAYVGNAPFTGRRSSLDMLDRWARSDDPVMIIQAISGAGKSALAWYWIRKAPQVIDRLAGCMWWSFSEGPASFTVFLQYLLAYVSEQPILQIYGLDQSSLTAQTLACLRAKPFLIVLDGFERLLDLTNRLEPIGSQQADISFRHASSSDFGAEQMMRQLTTVGPSKIIITTTAMPTSLSGEFGGPLAGVQHQLLPGLTQADTMSLLRRLGVRGSRSSVKNFFGSFGYHPLLVGIVARKIRMYRPKPGDLDHWLGDPAAGAAFRVSDPDFERQFSWIFAAALDDLSPNAGLLLEWMSQMPAVRWETMKVVNPFAPTPEVTGNNSPFSLGALNLPARLFGYQSTALSSPGAMGNGMIGTGESMTQSGSVRPPPGEMLEALDAALRDLDDHGLLLWDRVANSYDLHPIIRSFVREKMEKGKQGYGSVVPQSETPTGWAE